MDINSKLVEQGIVLPDAPPPAANYIPFVKVDKLVFISGQVSQNENGFIKGFLGEDFFNISIHGKAVAHGHWIFWDIRGDNWKWR